MTTEWKRKVAITIDNVQIRNSLSLAIKEAARKEITRLCRGLTKKDKPVHVARAVEGSLRSLEGLWKGGKPDYRQWDPLMYSTWYQASQINLAYSALSWTNEIYLPGNPLRIDGGRWQIVDFGSGTLALQFAVALAAADALRRGITKDLIRVDSVDSSSEMTRLGRRIWKEFSSIVRSEHPQDELCEVFDVMELKSHESIDSVERIKGASYYITAIHAVYGANIQAVKADLKTLANEVQPVACLLTTFNLKEWMLGYVSPLRENPNYNEWKTGVKGSINIKPYFGGIVSDVYNWRTELWDYLSGGGTQSATRLREPNFVNRLLTNYVTWTYAPAAVLAHTRRPADDDLPW